MLTGLHALVVFDPRPQQSAHQTLRDARPDAKVQVRSVRPPEQAVIAGPCNIRDLRSTVGGSELPLGLQRQYTRQACPEATLSGRGWHGLYHLLSRGEE
jgi:hypothetical protein